MKNKYIGIIVAVIVVIIGNSCNNTNINKKLDYKYNNFEFVKDEFFWHVAIEQEGQPYYIAFYNHPTELEDIKIEHGIEQKLLSLGKKDQIYITLKPNSDSSLVIASVELAKLTGERYDILGVPTKGALTQEGFGDEIPVITCDDSDDNTIVIWLDIELKNSIYSKENCIILEAKSANESIMVADRLAYAILGIMPS